MGPPRPLWPRSPCEGGEVVPQQPVRNRPAGTRPLGPRPSLPREGSSVVHLLAGRQTERADPSERRPDHPGVGSAQPSLCVRHGLCGDVRPPQTSPGSLGLGAVPVGGQDRDEGRPAPCSAASSPRGHHPPGVRRSWRSRGDKQK